jgi:hypothetical protein
VLSSGQKLTLGLLASITFEVVPSARIHRAQPFCHCFKCILEVVFSEGVQHCPRFCVKIATSQFDLLSGTLSKVGWVGDDSHNSRLLEEPSLATTF